VTAGVHGGDVQITYSARGYWELSALLAGPATAERADCQAVFLFIGNAERECPILPRCVRVARPDLSGGLASWK
jgi:hypothetical protein